MKKIFKNTSFSIHPEGTDIAILQKYVGLGLQENSLQGTTKLQPQARLTFQSPALLTDDGKPATISKILHESGHEKSTYFAWGEALMGKGCMAEGLDPRDFVYVDRGTCAQAGRRYQRQH